MTSRRSRCSRSAKQGNELTRPARGMTANPCWPSGLRTMCGVVRRIAAGLVDQSPGEASVGEREPDRHGQIHAEQGGAGPSRWPSLFRFTL